MVDFGLVEICKKHDAVVFDYSALNAPFDYRPWGHDDPFLLEYCAALRSVDKRRVPEAMFHLFHRFKDSSELNRALVGIFVDFVDSVGYKHHKLLRKHCLEIAVRHGVFESYRHSLMLALALARDVAGKKGVRAGYLTSRKENASAYADLRKVVGIPHDRAVSYLYDRMSRRYVFS